MAKADDAIEYAKTAQDIAARAMVTAQVQGVIFDALISVLRDSGFIPHDAVERVYLFAAAVIDDSDPKSEIERQTVVSMREVVERVASSFGVTIPPPGQIAMPRKH